MILYPLYLKFDIVSKII